MIKDCIVRSIVEWSMLVENTLNLLALRPQSALPVVHLQVTSTEMLQVPVLVIHRNSITHIGY